MTSAMFPGASTLDVWKGIHLLSNSFISEFTNSHELHELHPTPELCHRLLGWPASEYGRLRHGARGPRTGRPPPEGVHVDYAPLNIKNLPDALYRKLKARARRQRRSVAQGSFTSCPRRWRALAPGAF
jgi:hypothetical protein